MTVLIYPLSTVLEVIDGDTIRLNIDLGFTVTVGPLLMRLYGCNAAEHGTPGGDAATAHLKSILPAGAKVTVRSYGLDKYAGRFDGDLLSPDGSTLVQQLVASQWVATWTGTGPKPVPPWPRTVTP